MWKWGVERSLLGNYICDDERRAHTHGYVLGSAHWGESSSILLLLLLLLLLLQRRMPDTYQPVPFLFNILFGTAVVAMVDVSERTDNGK